MIVINDRFSCERDSYNWILSEKRAGIGKEGQAIENVKQTFYSNFESMCKAVIDKSMGSCESLVEVKELLKDVVGYLKSDKANAIAQMREEYEVAE